MKTLSAALAAAIALAGTASAQQDIVSNPRGVVTNFDIANVGPILTEMGAVWQQAQGANGQPYIQVSAGGDLVLNIFPAACQGANFTGCVGMNTVALFSGMDLNYQTITAFNQRYHFSTAGVAPDGQTAYISRYDIADYGIARGNIAASVLNLAFVADYFRKELSTGAKTISQQGHAADMSARLLNGRTLEALGGTVAHGTRHQRAFEESAEFIEILMKDRDAPRNKIDNTAAKR